LLNADDGKVCKHFPQVIMAVVVTSSLIFAADCFALEVSNTTTSLLIVSRTIVLFDKQPSVSSTSTKERNLALSRIGWLATDIAWTNYMLQYFPSINN
jgi:hypothetical protein